MALSVENIKTQEIDNIIGTSPSSRYDIRSRISSNEQLRSVKINLDDEKLDTRYYNYEFKLDIRTSSDLSAKQYLLIIPITNFFKKARNLYVLYNILRCKSVISLRLIEYFVVNYVLDNNTHFNLTRYKMNLSYLIDNLFNINKSWTDYNISYDEKNELYTDLFMIHDNYKCKLKEYNKKNFDPFCRWQRIVMIYEKENQLVNGEMITLSEKSFETTVAQLNFFKWIIENHILDYIIENFEKINLAMNEFEKDIKRNKKQQIPKNLISNINNDELTTELETEVQNLRMNKPVNMSDINIQGMKKTRKKEIVYCNADRKTNKKARIKKEFTKTNRNIMKYNKAITLSFN